VTKKRTANLKVGVYGFLDNGSGENTFIEDLLVHISLQLGDLGITTGSGCELYRIYTGTGEKWDQSG
jgi:hypothetical protein